MKTNAVKALRLKLRWQQAELAQAIGVSRGSVCHWETSCRSPSLVSIKKMEDIAHKHGIKFNSDDFIKRK